MKAIVADQAGIAKVSLWEEHIDDMRDGACYQLLHHSRFSVSTISLCQKKEVKSLSLELWPSNLILGRKSLYRM